MESHCDLVSIDLDGVHTNIAFINMLKDEIPAQHLHDRLLQVFICIYISGKMLKKYVYNPYKTLI